MIFQADLAFSATLIALALGAFLLQQPKNQIISKIVAYVVLVGGALTLICISVNAYKSYQGGGYNMPMRPMMMGPHMPGATGGPTGMPHMMMPTPTGTPGAGEKAPTEK